MIKNDLNSNQFKSLNTAVLLLTFNRLDTTKEVFQSIRKAKIPRLYIWSDGPRSEVNQEDVKVREVRNYLISNIDWPCEVKTRFNEVNLGIKKGISSSIDWFFENEEMGIILEDDCLPSQSFFWYCEEVLERFKNDHRVMQIAGMTYVEKPNNALDYSYHFCKVGGIWGWASWRRAWELYENEMESFSKAKEENLFDNLFIDQNERKKYMLDLFERHYGTSGTWDFQWSYTKIVNNSINIMPSKNLIVNIGHGHDQATNTNSGNNRYSNMKLKELSFPLKHPKFVAIDVSFDYLNYKYVTYRNWKHSIYYYIDSKFPKWISMLLKKIKNLL